MSKTATRWQIMQTAASQLGYVEGGGPDGRSGNITKYWADRYPAWQKSAWCGCFVDWCLAKHGASGYPVGITGIFYTPTIVNAAKQKGAWRSDSTASLSKAQPGDLALFDFNGSGNAQHVGFVEKYLGNGLVQTIEGNTSPTNVGSQNNGGGVYRRTRNTASIMGYVDMSQWLAKDADDLAKKPTGSKPSTPSSTSALRKEWLGKQLAVHGKLSVGTIKRLQAEVGASIDGVLGPATRRAVQKWLGVSQDSVWGPKTYSAMQKRVGASQTTGRWTPWLGKALQSYLNETRRKA